MKAWVFLALFGALFAQTVQTPGMEQAECFLQDGRWICDFEYHLRQKGPGYESFSGGGVPSGFGKFGGSTGTAGSMCIHSMPGTAQSYSYCGGSAHGSGWENPSAWQWQVGRQIVTNWGYLPGQFIAARTELEAAKLRDSRNAYSGYESKVSQLAENVRQGQKLYSDQTLAPSVDKVVSDSIPHVQETLKENLLAPLENLPEVEPPDTKLRVEEPATGPAVSEAIRGFADRALPQDARAKWEELEPLWSLALDPTLPLPDRDREAVRSTYRRYFDENGLLTATTLGEAPGKVAKAVGESLRTRVDTVDGISVRYEMNRGLVAYASAPSESRREWAQAGLAMGLGADQAFADGRREDGNRLLKMAATGIDFGLGFVPIVSSINDAAQIVMGMVTGRDYAGNEMTSADYALRGVTAVLGIVGAGAAGKVVVKIGSRVLGKSFALGASVIRKLRLGDEVLKASKGEVAVATEIAEQVGKHPGLLKGEVITAETVTNDVLKGVNHGSDAVKARHAEELTLLEKSILEGDEIRRFGPLNLGPLSEEVANSFRSASYFEQVTTKPLKLYRVWGGPRAKEFGAYWSRVKPTGRYQASLDFALDPTFKNTAASWSEITVPVGTKIYDGFAAPIVKDGIFILGGGPQTFVPRVLESWWTARGVF